jgi:hypothetical protein
MMTPEQLLWILDHNAQIRGSHRVQIAEAARAWRVAEARVRALEEAMECVLLAETLDYAVSVAMDELAKAGGGEVREPDA